MAYISGTARFQLGLSEMFSFGNLIAEDNPIRVIDAFVNNINLQELEFVVYAGDKRGQKPYKTSDLLKIHLYCFYNGIQSSRKQERDVYICPAKKELVFSRKSTETRNSNKTTFKIYVGTSCYKCPYNTKCTKAVNGRSIKRHPKEDKLDEFETEYRKDSSLYKMRKELVEHPFGTIKRTVGLTHVYIKGISRMSSWAASVFLAYNLKRVINIVDVKELIAKLDALMGV